MTVTVVGAVLLLYLPELDFTHPAKHDGEIELTLLQKWHNPFFQNNVPGSA